MPTIVHAVATRPNFVKMAPLIAALGRHPGIRQIVVHTGQHYDHALSRDVIADLGLPEADRHLGVGSCTHGEQTGLTLIAAERVLLEERPDLVVVAGDVNATLAGALAASKLCIPVAHLESGLRSRDRTMPEEQNRVLVDHLADLLLAPSHDAVENLLCEGIDPARVHEVGNTMIDSLRRLEPRARRRAAWRDHRLEERGYVLVTLHRPSNVDSPPRLAAVVDGLVGLAARARVLFPIHPRTDRQLHDARLTRVLRRAGIILAPPLRYLDFVSLELAAAAVVTDSGGVQEETSVLGVPCYTLRPSTERPITISHGTNTLLGDDPSALAEVRLLASPPTPCAIPLWDGRAAERAAAVVATTVTAPFETEEAMLA